MYCLEFCHLCWIDLLWTVAHIAWCKIGGNIFYRILGRKYIFGGMWLSVANRYLLFSLILLYPCLFSFRLLKHFTLLTIHAKLQFICTKHNFHRESVLSRIQKLSFASFNVPCPFGTFIAPPLWWTLRSGKNCIWPNSESESQLNISCQAKIRIRIIWSFQNIEIKNFTTSPSSPPGSPPVP